MLKYQFILFFIYTLYANFSISQSFEEKIERYLLNNPEIILKSLKNYEEKIEKQQLKDDLKKIKSNLDSLNDISNGMYAGNKNSQKVIIKFLILIVPIVKKAYPDMEKIVRKPDIKVIYKNFPILSENSVYLAKVAILIAEQGVQKFNKFYKFINETKGRISEEKLMKIVNELKINLNDLKNEDINQRIEKKLKKDIDLANKLGLRGTPAFVVGEEIIFGYISSDELMKKIN